jgi:hypothetical protein
MRQLNGILIALTVATFQTHAGTLDWLFGVGSNDDFARRQAQFLVWDGVPHSLSAKFDKVNMVDKATPFYLFNVVMINPGTRGERNRTSYLVCFKLFEDRTEFHIVTGVQYASDPPTENEISIDKRLNKWPSSPPWKVGDELPYKVLASGLGIVLDKCRAGSEQ